MTEDNKTTLASPSQITQQLIDMLTERDEHGLKKYGVTLDRTDLTLRDWLQHHLEELLDAAGYVMCQMRELDKAGGKETKFFYTSGDPNPVKTATELRDLLAAAPTKEA